MQGRLLVDGEQGFHSGVQRWQWWRRERERERERDRERELTTARPNFRHERAVFGGSLAQPAGSAPAVVPECSVQLYTIFRISME